MGETRPHIEVGIMKAGRIRFSFEGSFRINGHPEESLKTGEAFLEKGRLRIGPRGREFVTGEHVILEPLDLKSGRFVIHDVVIGIGFHWEQKEDQKFQGALKLMAIGNEIQAVNIISIEDYLISVISSEMRGDSSPALLKAHTIISRSWLLAQIEKQDKLEEGSVSHEMVRESGEEYIRWYDREDHDDYHVCADDHCQRYQGVTRAHNPGVVEAVLATEGEVLVYDGKICDARFSKCCGGVSEQFENCWEPVFHPYLQRVDDNPGPGPVNGEDLKIETNAVRFIEAAPLAFCNTGDEGLLMQVLNDYDLASRDFYRWIVAYTQQEIAELIREKSGTDFGEIVDLVPVERGESGRLVRLLIVGTRKRIILGKELEIRRWLSKSHLYSSAFTVHSGEIENGIPGKFILHGAGWGHGVGLCQIGAAVMASRGYSHGEILAHYFRDATIKKRYEQTR